MLFGYVYVAYALIIFYTYVNVALRMRVLRLCFALVWILCSIWIVLVVGLLMPFSCVCVAYTHLCGCCFAYAFPKLIFCACVDIVHYVDDISGWIAFASHTHSPCMGS